MIPIFASEKDQIDYILYEFNLLSVKDTKTFLNRVILYLDKYTDNTPINQVRKNPRKF